MTSLILEVFLLNCFQNIYSKKILRLVKILKHVLFTGNLLWNKVVNRSFTAMFAINTFLMTLATLYTVIFLKWQTRPEQKSLKEAGIKNPVTDFFDAKNIIHTVTTLTQKRPNNRRLFLWFLLISMAFYTFQRGWFWYLYRFL